MNYLQKKSNLIADVLQTALEGGSNYWYCLGGKACKTYRAYKTADEPYAGQAIVAALLDGKTIPVHDVESMELLGTLRRSEFNRNIETLRDSDPYTWAEIVEGDYDTTSADVFFQYVLMGEVIFG